MTEFVSNGGHCVCDTTPEERKSPMITLCYTIDWERVNSTSEVIHLYD